MDIFFKICILNFNFNCNCIKRLAIAQGTRMHMVWGGDINHFHDIYHLISGGYYDPERP